MSRQYFAIIDTETTCRDTVADIAIVICDRSGRIYNQMAVLVKGQFDDCELYYDNRKRDKLWSFENALKKRKHYDTLLQNGTRILRSVQAINTWIGKAIQVYDPILTAYNLPFDVSKCRATGIDVSGFSDRFCLWSAASGNICNTREYRQFVVDNHLFNKPTAKGNMTFQTNAEAVFSFLHGQVVTEPHTALEDAIDFELPILVHILKKFNWKTKVQSYDWNKFQVRNHFKAL